MVAAVVPNDVPVAAVRAVGFPAAFPVVSPAASAARAILQGVARLDFVGTGDAGVAAASG